MLLTGADTQISPLKPDKLLEAAREQKARVVIITRPLGDEIGEIPPNVLASGVTAGPDIPFTEMLTAIGRDTGAAVEATMPDFIAQIERPHDSLFDVNDVYFTRSGNDFYASVVARILLKSYLPR